MNGVHARALCMLVLLLSCLPTVAGRLCGYNVPQRQFTVEGGLPHSNVFRIFQDRKGYVWFGSEYGLCRYDGNRFDTFDHYEPIRNKSILSFMETPQGALWISTYDERLHIYEHGRFREYFAAAGGIPYGIVDLHIDHKGTIWCEKTGGLIYQIERDTISRYYSGLPPRPDNMPRLLVNSMIVLRNGDLAFACNTGFYTSRNDKTVRRYNEVLAGRRVGEVVEDSAGVLWLGLEGGVIRIGAKGNIEEFRADFCAGRLVEVLCADIHGNMWVVFSGGTLGAIRA